MVCLSPVGFGVKLTFRALALRRGRLLTLETSAKHHIPQAYFNCPSIELQMHWNIERALGKLGKHLASPHATKIPFSCFPSFSRESIAFTPSAFY